MIKHICKNKQVKSYLQSKLSQMTQQDISNNFDHIINNTSDLEFYAYYHHLFINSPNYKNFDTSKSQYQKNLYQRKFKTIKSITNINNKHILDIGQEDYYYANLYNNNNTNTKMDGINVSLSMNYKGDKSQIQIYDGVNIPFNNDTFDIVVMHMVLHHVINNYNELLKDIYRVLKNGGVFIIEDHNFTNETTNNFIDVYHYLYEMVESMEFNTDYYNNYEIRRFTKDELLVTLKDIGFKNPKFIINDNNNYLNKYYLAIYK